MGTYFICRWQKKKLKSNIWNFHVKSAEIIIQLRCLCYVCSKMMKIVFLSGYIIRFNNISNHDRGTWRVSIHNFCHFPEYILFVSIYPFPFKFRIFQCKYMYEPIFIYNMNVSCWMNLNYGPSLSPSHSLFSISCVWMDIVHIRGITYAHCILLTKKKKEFMIKWNEWKPAIIEEIDVSFSGPFNSNYKSSKTKFILNNYVLDTPHLKTWIMSIYRKYIK